MKLRYVVAVNDLVALTRYHQEHSPAVQRAIVRLNWRIAIMWFVFVVLASCGLTAPGRSGMLLAGAALGATLGGISLALFPALHRQDLDRHARRMYREGANNILIGPQELELTDGTVIYRNQFVESRAKLSAVERVVSDAGYTFIYLGAMSAYVIPHAAVTAGDPEVFSAALRQKLADTALAADEEKSSPGTVG